MLVYLSLYIYSNKFQVINIKFSDFLLYYNLLTFFEEGKASLTLAIQTANENNSTIILANDPDADRMGIAEKQPDNEWKIYTGNEIGALLGWWIWHNFKVATFNIFIYGSRDET